jgi:hypothetical protein
MDKLYAYIREQFEKDLDASDSRVWKKDELLIIFDKASIKAINRLAREMGVDLT